MLKKKTKVMVLLLAIILIISTVSFATEDTAVVTSDTEGTAIVETEEATDSETESTEVDETATDTDEDEDDTTTEIRNEDLYIFDDEINMDQLVDGNVYLVGNTINVTGKVNGNLFAIGNNVTFSEDAYVVQGIYVLANTLTMNGCANDLYAAATTVDMSYDSFMIRDLKVAATTFNFYGGVGRDAVVYANTFNFSTEEGNDAIVYGNLTYTASNELDVTSDYVQGTITYTKQEVQEEESTGDIILDKVIDACRAIIYAIVVLLLCVWLAPKFLAKTSSNITPANLAKSFGIGILTYVIACVAVFGLLFTVVGVPLAVAIAVLTLLVWSISTAVAGIAITYKLKEKFAYKKAYLTYLTLAGVILVIYVIGLIPYLGAIVGCVLNAAGLGIIVNYLFTKNKANKEENK
jgi:hypothetical protein